MQAMNSKGVDEGKIDNMMSDLYCAFTWAKTPQGQKYWEDVFENLASLREDPQPGVTLTELEKVNGG